MNTCPCQNKTTSSKVSHAASAAPQSSSKMTSEVAEVNALQNSTLKEYSNCCQKIHSDLKAAATAETMMRARYSAFAMKLHEFLFQSLDPSTRDEFDHEANREWAEKANFLGLTIEKVRPLGAKAQVQFKALYEIDGQNHTHRELSYFERKNGQWYFSRGKTL